MYQIKQTLYYKTNVNPHEGVICRIHIILINYNKTTLLWHVVRNSAAQSKK